MGCSSLAGCIVITPFLKNGRSTTLPGSSEPHDEAGWLRTDQSACLSYKGARSAARGGRLMLAAASGESHETALWAKKCFVRAPSVAPCGPRPVSRFGVVRRSGPGDDLSPHVLQLFCSPFDPFIQPVNERKGGTTGVAAGWPDVAFYVSLVPDRHVTLTP